MLAQQALNERTTKSQLHRLNRVLGCHAIAGEMTLAAMQYQSTLSSEALMSCAGLTLYTQTIHILQSMPMKPRFSCLYLSSQQQIPRPSLLVK